MEQVDWLDSSRSLLTWLPDETLFSLVSRLHLFWGYSTHTRTGEILFGRRHGYAQHDLPTRLAELTRRTGGAMGPAHQVALERTLLRFYRPFLNESGEAAVLSDMQGTSQANALRTLGAMTSTFWRGHPLKACSTCVAEDNREFGWSYWHLRHQFPGVCTCPEHGTLLWQFQPIDDLLARTAFHLPRQDRLRPSEELGDTELRSVLPLLDRLTRLAVGLAEVDPLVRVDRLEAVRIYRSKLTDRSFVTGGGVLRLTPIAKAFAGHIGTLRRIPEFCGLPEDGPALEDYVSRLFRRNAGYIHPISHLLAIDWLVGGFPELAAELERSRSAEGIPSGPPMETCSDGASLAESAPSLKVSDLLELVKTQGASVKAAAKALGIDKSTALIWARQAGIAVKRRPKVLKGEALKRLRQMLLDGADRSVIAQEVGVSVSAVNKYLWAETELAVSWAAKRKELLRSRSRNNWLSAVGEVGRLGIKAVRMREPAAFAWLMKHDVDWFEANKPLRTAERASQLKVDWSQRDADFCVRVEEICRGLRPLAGATKLRIGQILSELPELKSCYYGIEAMPRTQLALRIARSRRSVQSNQLDFFGGD